ncbi:MAG TPA: dihydroorotate dehydrogenase electron transfer subunit [Tissierellia bacterium]|nr:dihydroorotate dehydrogenase electron transfer subunit [Tissierellia bacterium]
MKIVKNRILKNQFVSEGVYRISVEADTQVKPGQFFMLKTLDNSFLLPRPLSVNDVNGNTVSFLYRVEGKGTKKISTLHEGEELQLFGPLGNGFDINDLKGTVAVVGGGMGVAPILYLVKLLGQKAEVYLGYKDSANMYICQEFKNISEKVVVVTEDGSFGEKGLVTDYVPYNKYTSVVACGPEIMMRKIAEHCTENEIQCYVSLERRMACGMGVCLGCNVETKAGNKKACKDGPVFSGEEIIW